MAQTFNLTTVGFAGDLFTHYIDGDFARPAEFATLDEAVAMANQVWSVTGRTMVVLHRCQAVYTAGAR